MLVLGGCQLLALGIMGEYIGRLHHNVNRKPQYVERHIFDERRITRPAGRPNRIATSPAGDLPMSVPATSDRDTAGQAREQLLARIATGLACPKCRGPLDPEPGTPRRA